MHFELKCVFSLDLSPDKESTRAVCALNVTVYVHIICNMTMQRKKNHHVKLRYGVCSPSSKIDFYKLTVVWK